MNDEHPSRRSDESAGDPPRSRWTVSPGSVSSAFGPRTGSTERPETGRRTERESTDDPPGRRTAREIIADVRKPFHDDSPTRVSVRRPGVPVPDRPAPRLDSDYDRPRSSAAPAKPAAPVQRRPHAPLYDESSRVAPELGEKRELRPLSPLTGGGPVLAGFGGVIMVVIAGLVGAIIDFLVTDRIGLLTTVGLTLGAAVAALLTRKRDLVSIIVAPPLVYAVIAAVVLTLSARPIRLTSIADVAIRGFPAMAFATGLAALIAGVRLFTSKVGERK